MKQVRAWLAEFRWILWVLAAVVAAFLFAMVSPFLFQQGSDGATVLPALPQTVQRKLDAAHEAALIAKTNAITKADTDKGDLKMIAKIDDGAERRRRLAEKLRTL